ncbi:MAG: cupin domain-containing protein [Chloroflexi bacterium]|nr:MAG: cupin domain-containing protein [Chloroflexota bacterium]
MAADAVIINSREAPAQIIGVHGGIGPMFWKRLATGGMLHGDWESFEYCRVPPGSVIGEHVHSRTEEIYYIVTGRGEMRMNDARREVGPGDLIVTPLNGKHGIANIGDEDLEFLVVEVLPPAITAVLPALSPVAEAGR